ncbi:MAG: biotin transporter BioY [Chlamydiia bacterium]|nr:biotin transporter BioY [Chlamydiia bacterium]
MAIETRLGTLPSMRSLSTFLAVVGGSVFLALLSRFSVFVPYSLVPVTLQTFGLFILAATLGKSHAAGAVAVYLCQASIGLPVLAGGLANPLWYIAPSGGYLFAFLPAVYVAAALLERDKKRGFLWHLFSFCAAQCVIYLLGSPWLAYFVGWDRTITAGVLPFLYGAFLKITAAACLSKPIAIVKRFLP